MKNPYKNMVKHFSKKPNDLYIANAGDGQYAYLADNYIVVRVLISDYVVYFHNVKPDMFPIIKPGEALSNGEPMASPDALPELYKRHEIDQENRAIKTSFLREVENNYSKTVVRLFITDWHGEPQGTQVQEKFVEALDIMDHFTSPGGSSQPLYFYNDKYGCDAIVCPVRTDDARDLGNMISHWRCV